MKNWYRINKYALDTIEGLGYRVITGDGFQNVSSIVEKESWNPLPCHIARISDLPEKKWYSYLEVMVNTEVAIYEGIQGEKICIAKSGATQIYFDENLIINIPFYGGDDELEPMDINIQFGKDKNMITLTYGELVKNVPDCIRNKIIVKDNSTNEEITYVSSHHPYTKIYSKNKSFGIDESSDDNITSYILNRIKKYKKGAYWKKDLKKGLDIISPALAIYICDFKKRWIDDIQNFINVKRQWNEEQEYIIRDIMRKKVKIRAEVEELKSAQKTLEQSLEGHLKHIRQNRKEQ